MFDSYQAPYVFLYIFEIVSVIFKELLIIILFLFSLLLKGDFYSIDIGGVLILFNRFFKLIYLLNKAFLTEIHFLRVAINHGLVLNFNLYLLIFSNGAWLSSK